MNAPENIATINAAHSVLLNAKDALSVTQVAQAIGASKPTASKQLKELYGLRLIESEPRAGGTPFYRLIAEPKADAGIPASEDIPTKTYPPAVLSALTEELADEDKPLDFATSPELQYLAPEDYEMPPADPEWLARANRMLGDRLEDVAHVLRGCGLPDLADASWAEDLQPKVAALAGAYQMALKDLEAKDNELFIQSKVVVDLRTQLAHLVQQVPTLTADLAASRAAHHHAINEADRLRLELFEATKMKAPAVGYLVKAPKLKPRRVTKPEQAQAAALAAVRGGATRADVLALVPVGTARRGAEWQGIQHLAKGD